MTISIACIVEGHGEVSAVPILIRRIGELLDPPVFPRVHSPLRVPRNKIVKPGELERAIEAMLRIAAPTAGVLVVLDADDDCPANLGPSLLQRATNYRSDIRVGVVIAKREFEAWFLAAADSLAGARGLASTSTAPPSPEDARGAKAWLTDRMSGSMTYSESLDQPALTAVMDIEMARSANSFDKCYREIVRLLTTV